MSELVSYPQSENIKWIDSELCYFSTAPQCSEFWDKLHIGSVSASKLTSWVGLSRFSEGPEESVKQCIGESKKSFDSKQLDAMSIGIREEPVVRDWYSKRIKEEIKEVGIAVWKEDPRFRASLDGIYKDKNGVTHGIEIKVPKKIYWPLVNSPDKDILNPEDDHSHIWDEHYNQMVQCMAVTGIKSIDYVVCGYETNEAFIQKIMPNDKYWRNELIPRAIKFLETSVEPMMLKKGIKRIDPYMMA